MKLSLKIILVFFLFGVVINAQSGIPRHIIKGLSFVASPRPFESDPFVDVKKVNSDWIAVIPYSFTRGGSDPKVHYNHDENDKKWWGESRKGIEETIVQAQANHLKIMLKPQVWYGRDWIGNLQFDNKKDWESWESSYEDYILPFAELAESSCVEILCIGTEIKQSVSQRPQFWERLIQKVRARYSGMITYAANWDEYKHINFWNKLDYIGIDAYFPLSEKTTPELAELMNPWDEVLNTLEKFSRKYNRKILFTEYGYLSVDGSAGKTWELEANLNKLNYNQEAQANSIQALLECCCKKDFWSGGFLWKWYPEPHNMRHDLQKDHSPQGKLAEEVLRKCYSKM
ncbi:MAG: hypothetical protein ABI844_10500 [Saprospiraceae bacterium]